MPQAVTRDPRDPTFPHGTPAGAFRGCTDDVCPATPTCRQRQAREKKRRRHDKLNGNPSRQPVGPVLEHIDALIAAVPRATDHYIALAAGMSRGSHLTRGLRGKYETVNRSTAQRLLALTPEALAAVMPQIPVEDLRWRIGTLQAAGFPLAWQQQESGIKNLRNYMQHTPREEYVRRDTYQALCDLAERIGDRMADPIRDGIPQRSISHAKACGRRAGYYPPSAYDDDGNVNPRFVPDHPWALLDELCGDALDVALDLTHVGPGRTLTDVARAHGWDKKRVERTWKDDLGLRAPAPGRAGIHPDCQPIVARIRAVCDDYETSRIGPVTAVLMLNLYDARWMGDNYDRDHPELLAWTRQEATAA